MHCVIVIQSVAQVLSQLGKETGGYEGGGRGVYAWFALLDGKLVKIQTLRGRSCRAWAWKQGQLLGHQKIQRLLPQARYLRTGIWVELWKEKSLLLLLTVARMWNDACNEAFLAGPKVVEGREYLELCNQEI